MEKDKTCFYGFGCFQVNILPSKVLSGNFFSNKFKPVPDGIAPVIPIIFVSCSACLINVSANTFVYDGAFDFDLACSPVETLNLDTP